MGERPGELLLVVHLEEGVEAGRRGGVVEVADLTVVERADDDEDGARAGLDRLQDLDAMHHEVLADGRDGRGAQRLVGDHALEVAELAAEVARVGQHGEGVGPRVGVGPGLGDGVDPLADGAGAGAGALDLGDDREGARAAQGGREAGAADLPTKGGGGQLGVGDGTHPVGDLDALPGHDLGELVHAA